jgi:hypothetical protein
MSEPYMHIELFGVYTAQQLKGVTVDMVAEQLDNGMFKVVELKRQPVADEWGYNEGPRRSERLQNKHTTYRTK